MSVTTFATNRAIHTLSAARCLALTLALLTTSGCERAWRNGFLDPTQTGRFESKPIRNEIRRTLGPLEEPEGIPGAVEPTREDLVVTYEESPIDRGDVIDISIFELIVPGQPADMRRLVNEVGYITLPTLGAMKVVGLTPRQLELQLVEKLKSDGVLQEPEVAVNVIQSQARRFSVVGNTNKVGEYPLPRPDFRVMDVIASIGPISPFQQKLYVLRGGKPAPQTTPGVEKHYDSARPGGTTRPAEKDPFAESDGINSLALSDFDAGRPVPAAPQGASLLDEIDPAMARHDSTAPPELLSSKGSGAAEVTPPGSSSRGSPSGTDFLELIDSRKSQPANDLDGSSTKKSGGNWVYVNGEWVEVAGAATSQMAPTSARTGTVDMTGTGKHDGVDWEALSQAESPLRIIEVAVDALQRGEMRYNLVIRPNDVINLPAEATGEYFVTGHIARPGAYSLNGRSTTVKEAVAAAGGFDLVAWPSRAEIIRRLPGDQEEIRSINLDRILGGDEPDFFLRPNDIINVGTTAAAPFLATIRNSFRMSYGFGFVYDRNFADIDSYGPKLNPQVIDQARSAERRQQFGIPIGF